MFGHIEGCPDVIDLDNIKNWLGADSDWGYGTMTDEIITTTLSSNTLIDKTVAQLEEVMTHAEAMAQSDDPFRTSVGNNASLMTVKSVQPSCRKWCVQFSQQTILLRSSESDMFHYNVYKL